MKTSVTPTGSGWVDDNHVRMLVKCHCTHPYILLYDLRMDFTEDNVLFVLGLIALQVDRVTVDLYFEGIGIGRVAAAPAVSMHHMYLTLWR